MSDQKLRKNLIRVASSLPKGSDERRKVLALLKKRGAGIAVNEREIAKYLGQFWTEYSGPESLFDAMGLEVTSFDQSPKIKIRAIDAGEEDMEVIADIEGTIGFKANTPARSARVEGASGTMRVKIKGVPFTVDRRFAPKAWM